MTSPKTERLYAIDQSGQRHSAASLYEEYRVFVTGVVATAVRHCRMQRLSPALMSYGFEGLLLAAERYEPTQGTPFESYARPYVRGRIFDALKKELVEVVGREYAHRNHLRVSSLSQELMVDPRTDIDALLQMRKITEEVDQLPESSRTVLRAVLRGETITEQAESTDRSYGQLMHAYRDGCRAIGDRISARFNARQDTERTRARAGLYRGRPMHRDNNDIEQEVSECG